MRPSQWGPTAPQARKRKNRDSSALSRKGIGDSEERGAAPPPSSHAPRRPWRRRQSARRRRWSPANPPPFLLLFTLRFPNPICKIHKQSAGASVMLCANGRPSPRPGMSISIRERERGKILARSAKGQVLFRDRDPSRCHWRPGVCAARSRAGCMRAAFSSATRPAQNQLALITVTNLDGSLQSPD
jgi:hypothetical protein